jgi:iron complex transport system permease protein
MTASSPARHAILHGSMYLLLFVGVVFVCPFFGGESISFERALRDGATVDHEIFFYQRIPRIILAAFVGGSLAVIGACLQVILRNPLAEPYTLGITGGASVGAVFAITIPFLNVSWGPFSSVQLCSMIGAGVTLFLIYRIARNTKGMSMQTLLLAGVTISILSAGVILFIRYLANPYYLVEINRWFMGGLDVVGYKELAGLFPLLLPGLWLLFSCAVELNHLSLGEDMAFGHGVDVYSIQRRVFIGGGISTAAVVSLSGPIGFVGLIIPHAVRQISGFDQRIVLPASFLGGAAFLVLCDTVARTVLSPMEMPVGIITAMIGGPTFIYILLTRKGI